MSGITLEINDSALIKLTGEMAGRIDNRMMAMSLIGDLAKESIRTNFTVGGRPGWKALKYRSGSPLNDTGRLKNSIGKQVNNNSVIIGTNVVYAAIHNFGGSTGPSVIRPKNKKALFWPGAGHPVKEVHHPGSVIPQREFMLLQDEDVTEIKDLLAEWIVEGRI